MTVDVNEITQVFADHPTEVAVTAGSALILLILAVRAIRRASRAAGRLRARAGDEQLLTVATSTIATGVAAQGMWGYFETLHIPVWLRVLFFAFLELMVVTSALRARTSMREGHGTGADGIAMWVLTSLSAVLSATHAASPGEVLLRLSAPLVAAWGWERSMALERRQRTGRRGINWRISPERVLIRLGLADPTDRTAGEVDAHRRLLRLAIAAKRARRAGRGRRKWASRRLDRAMEGAVEYGGLGTDPDSQAALMATLGALVNTSALLDLQPPAPWEERMPVTAVAERVSGASDTVAELEAATAPDPAVLGHPQTASDTGLSTGQPLVHSLDDAIRSAKASGLSLREIAQAFEVTKYRVEKALTTGSGSDASDEQPEPSEIAPPGDEGQGEEAVTEPLGPDGRRRRFAVRVRRWLVTAEESNNGHRPEVG